MHKLVSTMRKAIEFYDMIQNGDQIAVGVSGGKDSLTLLTLLNNYKIFSPQKFKIIAIAIDLTNGETDFSKVQEYCNTLHVPLHIVPSNIKRVVFDIRKESNPCSLCAKLRRGTLNTYAKNFNCNKIALGHHKDDFVQTFLLSLCYEGRLSSFQPKSYLNKVDLTVIRPMIYINEKDIIYLSNKLNLPVVNSCCPANKLTKREYMKNLIKDLEKDIPNCQDRMFDAITNLDRMHLL